MGVAGRDGNKLCEPAVALRPQEPRLGQHASTGFLQTRLHQYALTDSLFADLITHSCDMTAYIDTLNSRKSKRLAGPTGVFGTRIPLGVPSNAGKDPLPLAVYEEGCTYRSWAIKALQKKGRAYWIAFVSPSISSILAAVKAGLTVAPLEEARLTTHCDRWVRKMDFLCCPFPKSVSTRRPPQTASP